MFRVTTQKNNPAESSISEILAAFEDSCWEEKYPPILTVDQAAELASVPKKTIYEWSSRGLLDELANRFGRRLRINRNRFIQLLMNNQGDHN